MQEQNTNGARPAGEVAGGRAAPEGSDGEAARQRVPDPELVAQAKRRTFTAEYKARILAEADGCSAPGQVGASLRREGLYTSHLTAWHKQRKLGALKEPGKSRGRGPADRCDADWRATLDEVL